MRRTRIRGFVSRRSLAAAALLALTVAAALAATTATGAINPLSVVTPATTSSTDTCGYNPAGAPKPGGGTVQFDENTVTRAISFYGTGKNGHVGVFANDESGLLIGAGGTPSSSAGSTIGTLNSAIANGASVSSIPVASPAPPENPRAVPEIRCSFPSQRTCLADRPG
jgi:hypothetical protein